MPDWGTVPAFGSLVVATWALVEARLVRRRQKNEDLQGHAKEIVVSPSVITDVNDKTCIVEAQVTNYSEYVVRELFVHVHSRRTEDTVFDFVKELHPKQVLTVRRTCKPAPEPIELPMSDRLRVSASFVDVNGYKWQRWASGEILPPIDMRPSKNPVRRRIMRTPLIGKAIGRWKRRRNRPALRERHDD